MSHIDDDCRKLLTLAAHELRTPVQVVGGYLQMLSKDQAGPLSDRQRTLVDAAARSCARLTDLIKEMSEVSNLAAGRLSLERQRVNLGDLLREVAHELSIQSPSVAVEIREAARDAMVEGDASRLTQAFKAIVSSVAREDVEGARVLVDVRPTAGAESDRLSISVMMGPTPDGTAAHPLDDIDPWRGGTGLAIPIARLVVQASGGRLSQRSAGGERRAVVIELPSA